MIRRNIKRRIKRILYKCKRIKANNRKQNSKKIKEKNKKETAIFQNKKTKRA